MKKSVILLMGILGVLNVPREVAAQLLGKDLEAAIVFGGSTVQGPFQVTVVDPGLELDNIGGANHIDVDIFDDRLEFSFNQTAFHAPSPNLLTFTDFQGMIPAFSNVMIMSASPVLNEPARVSFSDDMFAFDVGDTVVTSDDFLVLKVLAVPEPSAVLLVIGAVALAGYSCRRR